MTLRLTAIVITSAYVATPLGAQTAQFKHPACGYALEHPVGWTVTVRAEDCAVLVRPGDYDRQVRDAAGVDVVTVMVSASAKPFLVAAAEAGFDFVDDEWVAVGRHGMTAPARTVRVGGWWGLRGTASVGCFGDAGYAGLCDVERAVMRDAEGNVFTVEGGPQSENVVAMILRSFTPGPP
jgi:hypothetical protein